MFGFFKNLLGIEHSAPPVQVLTQSHVPGVGTTTEMTDIDTGISTPIGFEADTTSFDSFSSFDDNSFGGGSGMGFD